MHPSDKPSLDNLDALFGYHAPNGTTIPKYGAINAAAKLLAKTILENAPDSADRDAAIGLVRMARMAANAAIACAPEPPAIVETPASA